MKISIILGTRPEIIKMSSIIRYCKEKKIDYFIIHTNQHYSENMDSIFFEELKLPKPKYNLNINQCSHAEMTGRMLIEIEKILIKEKPNIVLVEGDTNTVLAGGLCASKMNIKIGHVEAGLRSYDRNIPEETNRIITDYISDYLFCPTNLQKEILLKEGTSKEKIFVTGNTIVDAVYQNIKIAEEKINNEDKEDYFLLTLHRQENVDNQKKIKSIFNGLEKVYEKYRIKIIFPIHPRTKNKIKEFQLKIPKGIELIEPIGYLEFLLMEKNAKLILTDSGGIQEEACILKVPCVTLRENTERPETIKIGANIVAGTNPTRILNSVDKMLNKKRNWVNPFGDGKTGEIVINIIKNTIN